MKASISGNSVALSMTPSPHFRFAEVMEELEQ